MRRTRARLLASALVIATASVTSAAFALGVDNAHALSGPSTAAAGDAGLDVDSSDAPPESGFDGPMEGGFDVIPDAMVPPDATINIQEPTIAITGPQGQPSSGAATIETMNTGTLGTATITGGSFTLTDCGSSSCNYGGQSVTPPYSLGIECTPGAMTLSGILTVTEASGGTFDTAMVTCTRTSSPPMLAVNPDALMFGDHALGTVSAPQQITITNTGGSQLDNILISFSGTFASQWQASACTSAPCSIGAGGSFNVDIRFAPTAPHGSKDATLNVTSNGGSDTVSLQGRGTGGVMSVKGPMGPAYILDFGTIGLSQMSMLDIELENLGNASYTAMTSTPTAPYTIAAGPHPVAASGTKKIAVTCQSATATPTNNPQMVTITSDAYQGNSAAVQLRCQIANTMLQVMPTVFDFGEVRIGTARAPIDITLTNPPTAATAMISAFDLRDHKPGLTLTTPATPFSVAPGTMQAATLALSTAAETDLTGEYVELTVDGEPLMFPVLGKVVTPHSRVVPVNLLDLGTACVGTDVTGNVMLINDGTATLAVDPPQMDQSFVASAPGVPGSLAPTRSLTAAITPAQTAMGAIEGTLTWRDDVPSEHKIEVSLDYVASGTALSPRGLDFGIIPVDGDPAAPQHIKLQNCDLSATQIKIESLKTKQGTLGAWRIDPRVGYTKQLAAKELQAVTVTFEPPARGRYEAELTVQTASGRQVVKLVGDATGRDFDNTSFYACACNGPGAPSRGWPVLAAIAIVIFRRRRAPSSAR